MPLTRLSLLDRLRHSNSSDSWNEFANRYYSVVDEYARPYCDDENDKCDIVQNVWMTLMRVMPGFEYQPGRGGFRHLLKRIVRNVAIDWFRRDTRHRMLALDHLPDPESKTIEEIISDERASLIKQVIAITRQKSSPHVWNCFEQHVLRGRTAQDVADELRISANCVYVNASRILQRIRNRCQLMEQAGRHEL